MSFYAEGEYTSSCRSADGWLAEDLEHLEPSGHLAFASAQAYTSLRNSSWQVKIQSDLNSLTELRQLVVLFTF